MIDRALEIAADFVDAAEPNHSIVVEMIAANDRRVFEVAGRSVQSPDWRTSAIAVFDLAQQDPGAAWIPEHTTGLVAHIEVLSADLGMNWRPSPQLAPPTLSAAIHSAAQDR